MFIKEDKIKKNSVLIGNIIEQVDRLRKMTDSFLKFAKIEKQSHESVNIHDVLTENADEIKHKMGAGIQINKIF